MAQLELREVGYECRLQSASLPLFLLLFLVGVSEPLIPGGEGTSLRCLSASLPLGRVLPREQLGVAKAPHPTPRFLPGGSLAVLRGGHTGPGASLEAYSSDEQRLPGARGGEKGPGGSTSGLALRRREAQRDKQCRE